MKLLAAGSVAFSAVMGTVTASGLFLVNAVPVMAQQPAVSGLPANVVTPGGIGTFGSGTASITINGNTGQPLTGKQFEVYQLFTAQNSAGGESINYTWNTYYASAIRAVVGKALNRPAADVTEYMAIDYIQSLNTHKVEGANASQTLEGRYSDFRYFVEDLRNEIQNQGLNGTIVDVTGVKPDNSITLDGMPYGYYVVDEILTDSNGGHSAASLCMVNTANPDATMNVKSDYPSVIKKIEEDDNGTGWNDVADYEIGQTVPYKYLTSVPNMYGYDTYYFAFHDRMDQALTFDPASVVMTISDGQKTYTLTAAEMKVEQNINGNTFQITVDDLKKIVDREFSGRLQNDGSNTYGQAIQVTYDAKLNDQAASSTGRPGFENQVRLEFSNDPDTNGKGETGFTPWDTVVCFTFRLDGIKASDHNKTLEGAKFRLYKDEACTEEVHVKKVNGVDGYVVISTDSDKNADVSQAVEMVSDDKGVFNIIGLDQGTYWLKETAAPDGYRPLLDPVKLTITPTFTMDRDGYVQGDGATDKTLQSLTATAEIKSFLNGSDSTENKTLATDAATGTANLTVVNQVGSKLPVTGSTMTIIGLAAGCGLMVTALVMNRKAKKGKE